MQGQRTVRWGYRSCPAEPLRNSTAQSHRVARDRIGRSDTRAEIARRAFEGREVLFDERVFHGDPRHDERVCVECDAPLQVATDGLLFLDLAE